MEFLVKVRRNISLEKAEYIVFKWITINFRNKILHYVLNLSISQLISHTMFLRCQIFMSFASFSFMLCFINNGFTHSCMLVFRFVIKRFNCFGNPSVSYLSRCQVLQKIPFILYVLLEVIITIVYLIEQTLTENLFKANKTSIFKIKTLLPLLVIPSGTCQNCHQNFAKYQLVFGRNRN